MDARPKLWQQPNLDEPAAWMWWLWRFGNGLLPHADGVIRWYASGTVHHVPLASYWLLSADMMLYYQRKMMETFADGVYCEPVNELVLLASSAMFFMTLGGSLWQTTMSTSTQIIEL